MLWDLLERTLQRDSEAIAFSGASRTWSYAEFAEDVGRLAYGLEQLGIDPGDRVAILAPNGREYLAAYFAAAGIGSVLVPLNYRLAGPELAQILLDSRARLLLVDAQFTALANAAVGGGPDCAVRVLSLSSKPSAGAGSPRQVQLSDRCPDSWKPRSVEPNALAQLYYTSGTTGRAKGVMLTHSNVFVHAENAAIELGLSKNDCWAHIAPMFHLADAWASFAATSVGARHVAMPAFEAEAALRLLASGSVTLTNLVPTMLARMLATPLAQRLDYPGLRLILSGGSPIAPETVRRIMDVFGCPYAQTYGMTETSPFLTLGLLPEHLEQLPPEERLAWLSKTGRAFRGIELDVVNERGRRVERDGRQVGEIRVRGASVSPGYWERPEETAAAFRDGWLYTGDLAVADEEGFVNIVDRRADVIVSGGENVYSVEVENVVYRHPAVVEAATYGVPDAEWGEAVEVAVVLRAGHKVSGDELREFCRGQLARYKVPKRVRFLPELPRTGSGKISKRALRESA